MAETMRDRLDDVPLKMLRKADEPPPNELRKRGETAPNDLRKRQAHGRVLRRAAQLAGYDNDKELAGILGVAESTLSEWFTGDPHGGHPQTWRFQQHETLGPALLVAEGETTPGATVEFLVRVPTFKRPAA